MTSNEKWIHYISAKHRRSSGKPCHALTLMAKLNIHCLKILVSIWWDQLGVVYCDLLKLTKSITGDHYLLQLMCLSWALKKKRPLCEQKHNKMILQHDNARLPTWKHFNGNSYPQPLYSPDIALSNYHLFQLMAHGLAVQHLHFYEDVKKMGRLWLASKNMLFFQCGIQMLPERW